MGEAKIYRLRNIARKFFAVTYSRRAQTMLAERGVFYDWCRQAADGNLAKKISFAFGTVAEAFSIEKLKF